MANYFYIEEVLNRENQTTGYTIVKSVKYKKDLPAKAILIDLGGSKYDDYLNSPKDYYVSGNILKQIERQ